MRKKSFVPSIALIALAVVCLLVGVGVISFGAGAEGFMAKQRPARYTGLDLSPEMIRMAKGKRQWPCCPWAS